MGPTVALLRMPTFAGHRGMSLYRGCRTKGLGVLSAGFMRLLGMSQNFLMCDREQSLLLPPNLREWLAEDDLAWFVLDVVGELDLAAFYGEYRRDGWGRAAFDPAMMVALLIYAYVMGERSSRAIERHCREDVAFRVIAANQVPDHATIARFRARHEQALGELFEQVLGLCARAGLVSLGVVAVDSTKVAANASSMASRTYEQIAEELLGDAAAIDAAEDQEFGDARGDELPPELADPRSRRARLRLAKQQMEAEHQAAIDTHGERLAWRTEREAELGHRLAGRPPKAPPEQVPPQTKLNITIPGAPLCAKQSAPSPPQTPPAHWTRSPAGRRAAPPGSRCPLRC